MTRTIAGLLVGLALLPSTGERRSTTTTVYGWVADDQNRPLPAITAADVEMFVDEQRAVIESIRARGSLSLAVVLDTSRTVRWDREALGDELLALHKALKPGDRLRLSTVGGRPFSTPFRTGIPDLKRDVRRALDQGNGDGYGATPLWDALHAAVTLLAAEPAPRAVLLLSDGRATGNRHGLVDVADYAMEQHVLVHVIVRNAAQRIRQSPDRAVLVQPAAPIDVMATYTGGNLYTYPEAQREVAGLLFAGLGHQLSALHAFTFASPIRDGQPHTLRVVPTRPGYRARAPQAFVAPPGAGGRGQGSGIGDRGSEIGGSHSLWSRMKISRRGYAVRILSACSGFASSRLISRVSVEAQERRVRTGTR